MEPTPRARIWLNAIADPICTSDMRTTTTTVTYTALAGMPYVGDIYSLSVRCEGICGYKDGTHPAEEPCKGHAVVASKGKKLTGTGSYDRDRSKDADDDHSACQECTSCH